MFKNRSIEVCTDNPKLKCLWISLLLIFCSPTLANEASIVTGYNPVPVIEKDVEMLSARLNVALSENLNVRAVHQMFIDEKTLHHGYSGAVRVGSDQSFFVDLSYDFSQSGSYLPKQQTSAVLMTRLPDSAVGGFYEYHEKSYDFTHYRSLVVSAGHVVKQEWLIGGLSVTHYEGETPQIHVLLAMTNLEESDNNIVNFKISLGKHHRIANDVLLEPSFGAEVYLQGDVVVLPKFRSLKFMVEYHGSLLRSSYRTGISLGLKYLF